MSTASTRYPTVSACADHRTRQHELGREQHEHHDRVAAAEAERDEHGDRQQPLGHREQQLDLLPAEQRQRPLAGAREIGERQRAEREASTG